MDPKNVRWFVVLPQAVIGTAIPWVFGSNGILGVALLTIATAVVWLGLALRYRSRRIDSISGLRHVGDRVMVGNAAVALGLPLASCVLAASVGLDPVLEPSWAAWALTMPLLAILASSAVDWYVILPFRDGAEGLPACRVDVVPLSRRRRYTKLWIAHRLACEVTIAASLLATVALFAEHYSGGLSVVGAASSYLGGVGIAIGLAWKRWVMGGLRFCLRQGPAVGNWVTGDTGRRNHSGFVRDVSLDNGIKIVASPNGTERFISLPLAIPDVSREKTDYACNQSVCKQWLRTDGETRCEEYWRARDQADG